MALRPDTQIAVDGAFDHLVEMVNKAREAIKVCDFETGFNACVAAQDIVKLLTQTCAESLLMIALAESLRNAVDPEPEV